MRIFGENVDVEEFKRLQPPAVPPVEARSLTKESVYGPFAPFMGDIGAGESVTQSTAETLSAVWCAVHLIATVGIGTLPFKVYRETARGPVADRESRVAQLLRTRPNPMMTSAVFRRTLQAHVLLHGNGYAEIEWDGAGRPIALWPMLPDRTEPILVKTPTGLVLKYRYTTTAGQTVVLNAEDVFHILGHSHDGIKGMSVISAARNSFGLALAAERFGSAFFSNGAWPGVILQHPGSVSPEAALRLRASVENMHQGASKAFRLMIAEEGMKAEKFSIAPNDAQFLETRTFTIEEVARWFNLPPHKLKQMNRATWNNVEQMGIEFVTDCLRPWCVLWEQEADRKLLTAPQYSKFVPEGLLRGDIATRFAAYAVARQWGWMSVNDIREKEELPLLPADVGDVYLSPLNMTPTSSAGKPEAAPAPAIPAPPPPVVPDAVRASVRGLALQSLERLVRMEAAELRKHGGSSAKVSAWMREFYTPAHEARLVAAIGPVAKTFEALGDAAVDPVQIARSIVSRSTADLLEIPGADTQMAVRSLADAWEAARPREILSMIEEDKGK